jgi:Na+-driven multidrug efflux pump
MFVATPLIVFSYDLFSIYLGSDYSEHAEAATVMIILLLGVPLTFPTIVLSQVCIARGDVRPIAIRNLWIQLGNLALTLVLVGIFQMGALGSATATLIAFAVGYPLLFWPFAIQILNISWRRFFREVLVPGLLPAGAAACSGFLCSEFISSTVLRVAIGLLICGTVYTIAVIAVLRPIDRADVGRIRRLVWRNS